VAGGSPLLARPFLAVLAATLATFGGYSLLLPVLPLWVASGGAGPALAGSVTGVFMAATVITQLGVPALLRAVGHRTALVLAAVALGAPTALLVLTPSPWLAMPVSVVRGAGFGVLTVTGAALVSDLVPARVRGRATGIYGLALGVPQLVLLTGGVWAWARLGPTSVLLAGALLPLLALPAMGLLPRRVAPATPSEDTVPDAGRPHLLRAAVAPWLVMLVCAASAGGVITVLPLAQPAGPAAGALFALTAAQLVGRSISGELGDRLGLGGRVTAPALGVAALGAGMVAWGLTGVGTAAVLAGAGLVGLGFGAVQNDTLVTLFARAGPGRSGPASSVWNTAYDAGTGLGATTLSAVLGAAGAPWSFVVAALACVLALGSAPWLRPDRTGTPG
jgi:MFS family permease